MTKNVKASDLIKPEDDTTFSGAHYNHVATCAELVQIALVVSEFEAHVEALVDDGELTLSFGRNVSSCRYDEATKIAAAFFKFHLLAKAEEATVLSLNAEYGVAYKMPDDAHAGAATHFCTHVGSFAAYPYFRSLAAQMAWNAGCPLPPMPSIAAMPVVPESANDTTANSKRAPVAKIKRKALKPA